MSEQTTEPGVVEGGHLQKSLKGQRMATVSFGGVIEAGLFVGAWQFRPYRRHAMGDSVPKRLASLSPVSPNSLGVWQS
jgi:hypothetical protein